MSKTSCSFALDSPLLQVVEEERLVHRGAVQQPVRQSDGTGGRPEGQNVSSEDHFAGKYPSIPTRHTFGELVFGGGEEERAF